MPNRVELGRQFRMLWNISCFKVNEVLTEIGRTKPIRRAIIVLPERKWLKDDLKPNINRKHEWWKKRTEAGKF
jgi:hypothetical protein